MRPRRPVLPTRRGPRAPQLPRPLAGAGGARLWAYLPDPRHDLCTYDVGPGDLLFGVLAKYNTVGNVPDPEPAPDTGGGSSGSAGS
ncbi:hypothetical protein ACFYVR_21845 [Rhodococcus sp. NPDC003318]|uniref:hypothetical protein n=1 Tax=Rhodococcus sp. NPDC003318 TaxID=3364503 RepID=UPI0036B6B899